MAAAGAATTTVDSDEITGLPPAIPKEPNTHKICPHFDEHHKWGKLGALAPDQEKLLEEFLSLLKSEDLAQITVPTETPSHAALRFLRGHKFVIKKALAAFNTHIQWRRTFKIDDKRMRTTKESVGVNITEVMKFYPCGIKGMDRCGRPLFLKLYGHVDPARLEAVATPHTCASWETINVEKLKYLCDMNARQVGWHVEDCCVLLDLEGMSVGLFNSFIRTCMGECAKMVEPNYPENLGICIIINAPWYIKSVWAVAKLFLPARTAAKFKIYGYDYKATLAKYIDPDNLPMEYGGTGEKGFKSTKDILTGQGINFLESTEFLTRAFGKSCADAAKPTDLPQ